MPSLSKIPFDSLTLAAVVAELSAYAGGKVQKIWQPDEHSVALGIYKDGKEAVFYLSAHPVFARAHFITRRPTNMQPMPGLGVSLRARVDGSRFVSVDQMDFDRIIALNFETREGPHSLVAELMGKHSNLMLLDPEGRVIAAAKWVGRSKSKRPIQAMKLYDPPPFERKPSLMEATEGADVSLYQGASPFLRKLIGAMDAQGAIDAPDAMNAIKAMDAMNARQPSALQMIQTVVASGAFSPVLVEGLGAYPITVSALGYAEVPKSSISVALEQYFDFAIRDAAISSLRESLLGQLRRVLQAREAGLRELSQAADMAKRAGSFQLMGELLLAFGSSISEGATSFEGQDYEGNAVTIPLDPEKNYLENAELLFGKAKHAKAREGTVRDQITRLSSDRDDLLAFISQIESAERLDRLQDLRDAARKRRWLNEPVSSGKKKEERPFEGNRIRDLIGPSGFTILYGENSEANDYLLTRVAKPNDYWLHVRGSASAHAVIVTNNHPEKVSKEVIMFAAKIVVQHSPSKHSGYVPVDYTLRKYVRKPKGAAKGTALYTHEKTVHVEG